MCDATDAGRSPMIKERLKYDEILRLREVEEVRGTPITRDELLDSIEFVRATIRGYQSR